MNLQQLFLLLALAIPYITWGQTEPPAYGAKAISLGNAYVGVKGDFWSLYHNPAGIGGIQHPTAGLYFEKRYLLEEFNSGGLGFVYPFADRQAVGLQAQSFNVGTYNETKVGLSYGIAIFERLSVGAQVNYKSFSIESFGNANAVYVDVGLNLSITPELTMGVTAANVNRVKLEAQNLQEDLSTRLTAGLAYRPTDKVLFVADLQKEVDHELSFRGGIEYAINDILLARMGMSNEPLTWNAGFGLVFDAILLDAAVGFHEQLGYTPYVSLSYAFGKNRVPQS